MKNSEFKSQDSGWKRAALVGVCAALFAFCWQILVVHSNYGGNWTALYMIGPRTAVPPAIANEHLYIFPNSDGYDGQSFHITAHDPWMRRYKPNEVDIESFRYVRILVPAMAWMLALGQDRWLDPAYFAVILGFVFLGSYWLARFAARASLHPAWGLTFLLSPATLTSIDRMTVDIALAALCVAFVLYADCNERWKTIAVLACALLARETGWILFLAYEAFLLLRKRIVDAKLATMAIVPFLGWQLFVIIRSRDFGSAPQLLGWMPLAGFFDRLVHRAPYDLTGFAATLAVSFDYVALFGMALALALAVRIVVVNKAASADRMAILGFALAMVFLRGYHQWIDVFGFGRILAPLPLLVAMYYFRSNVWLGLAPTLLIDSRIALNFGKHAQQMIQSWIS